MKKYSFSSTIDLAVRTLPELVNLCFKKELIKEELYSKFLKNYSEERVVRFITLFENSQIDNYDFTRDQINITEHRRLSELLTQSFPA